MFKIAKLFPGLKIEIVKKLIALSVSSSYDQAPVGRFAGKKVNIDLKFNSVIRFYNQPNRRPI
jgi:hypothetical protein